MSKWTHMLEELRQEAGLSTRKLCILAGVNRSTYTRMVGGKLGSDNNIEDIEAILRLFGYELDAIKVGEPETLPKRPKRLCSVEGCDQKRAAKGLCRMHFHERRNRAFEKAAKRFAERQKSNKTTRTMLERAIANLEPWQLQRMKDHVERHGL